VTQVRWLDRGPEREESLISVSTDGRLTSWSTAKGLEHTQLMRLRRLPHAIGGGALPPLARAAGSEEGGGGGGRARGASAKGPQLQQQGAEADGRAARGPGSLAEAAAAQELARAAPAKPQPRASVKLAPQPRDKGAAGSRLPPPPAADAAAAAAAAATAERDACISQSTGGMSFDFSPRDPTIYLVGASMGVQCGRRGTGCLETPTPHQTPTPTPPREGTEDGWIHKCSTSYAEQYLESYRGHLGAVHQVRRRWD
jgi:hypothetical protein